MLTKDEFIDAMDELLSGNKKEAALASHQLFDHDANNRTNLEILEKQVVDRDRTIQMAAMVVLEHRREIEDLTQQLVNSKSENISLSILVNKQQEEIETLIAGECLGLIPNTFILCSEGGHYCSQHCLETKENG